MSFLKQISTSFKDKKWSDLINALTLIIYSCFILTPSEGIFFWFLFFAGFVWLGIFIYKRVLIAEKQRNL